MIGIVTSGPHRGEVHECTNDWIELTDLAGFVSEAENVPLVESLRYLYRLHRFAVGGRIYQVWDLALRGSKIPTDEVLLTLIDASPEDAERCRVR